MKSLTWRKVFDLVVQVCWWENWIARLCMFLDTSYFNVKLSWEFVYF